MALTITNKPDSVITKGYVRKGDETTRWAIIAYSFLIPFFKTVTAGELAELIKAAYDENDPRTAAVIRALQSY